MHESIRNVGIAGAFSKCWLLLFTSVKGAPQNCVQLPALGTSLGSWGSLLEHLLIAPCLLLVNTFLIPFIPLISSVAIA